MSKRRAISNETKIEIIENNKKLTQTELSVVYSLPISTIATIQGNKNKIIQYYEQNSKNASHKRIRLSNFPVIEESLQVWFNQVMTKPNMTIDGPLLKVQASKFAELHGITGFKASNGWLEGFKKRNNISFKTIVGEGGLVDNSIIENYKKNILPNLLKDYEPRNIFNADETALFYKALPNKTLYYKNLPANSVKTMKERLSVLFCANMDGSEKMRPVVIGSAENPRYFKNINKSNLPVFYRSNKTSWMTNEIFTEWLIHIDKHFKAESRNILLFLDNFSGHIKSDLKLSNIKIQYFPPNCTAVLQPMDQGIIQAFKMKYRRCIIEEKLEAINTDSALPDLNVLFAINKLNKCWRNICKGTIKNCFLKGGFKKETISDTGIIEIEDDVEIEKQLLKNLNPMISKHNFNFDIYQYVAVDENLACFGDLTDDQIANHVLEKNKIEEIVEDSVDSVDLIDFPKISPKEALEYVDKLRTYCQQSNGECDNHLQNLEKLEDHIEKSRRLNQSTIDKYFIINN